VKTLWDPRAREELAQRLDRLKPDSPRRWGKMTASQMIAHLVDAMKMATGKLKAADKKLPIRFAPLKQLIIYGPPFPKGAPTAPEVLGRECEDWDTECRSLKEMMDAFASFPPEAEFPRHPAFGRLSRRAWGRLGYKHIDHHLKQFGA